MTHLHQLGLTWVVQRSYPPHLSSNPTCDMFAPRAPIGAGKVPEISLSFKCFRVGQDVSKHLNPRLLGIWLVPCQRVPGSNPHGWGTLVYANGFTRDAINECGEASPEFPREVFLGKKVSWNVNKQWKYIKALFVFTFILGALQAS
jgi:hypothetical protein